MNEVPGDSTQKSADLKQWINEHRPVAAASVLAMVTLVLAVVAVLRKPPVEKIDPQEQIGLKWIKAEGSEAAYAGNGACRACHAHEYEQYHASPHSRTVKAIVQGDERPEFATKQTITDDLHGVTYTLMKGGGKNQVLAASGSETHPAAARWAFGSGTQAWTYLAQNGPKFLQLRVSYYPPVGEWNFTPGSGPGTPFHNILGDPYTSGEAAACFGCHSTVLIGTRQQLDLGHSILNVGCESCHGPCRSHVDSMSGVAAGASRTAQNAAILPPKYDGLQTMNLCGNCHRIPVAVSDEQAASQSQLARFPGAALPRSRCFIASAGKLSCVTCHDPHQSTRAQTEVSFDAKCISCHSAPHGATCARGELSRCVSCHMPVETIARRLSLRFHNHWIRRDPLGAN